MIALKAEDGLVRILETFSSLLFLTFERSALTPCLRAALATQSFYLAASMASAVGLDFWLCRNLLAFSTALSRVPISLLTMGLGVLVLARSTNLLVERAAKDKEE